MKNKSIILINIAVILFSFAGLFGKWISIPSLGITFGRVFFSSITLSLVIRFTKADIHLKEKKDLYLMILSGFILAFHWWAFLGSIQLSTVAIGSVTASSFPLFLTFMEPIVFKEKLELGDAIAALCILVGVIVTLPSLDFENSMLIGALTGVAAAILYAILCLFNRYFSRKYSGTIISFYEQSMAAVTLLPLVLFSGIRPNGTDILLLALLGVFCTALAHTLYINSLKHVSAQFAGVCSSMENVFSIGMAFLFLHEIPSIRNLIGAAIIISTVTLNQLRKQ